MKLLPNKIYRAYAFTTGTPLPTLEVKGNPKIFVSLADLQPKNIHEMTDVTSEIKQGMNLLNGQIRWLAFTASTKDDAVNECGIITKGTQG